MQAIIKLWKTSPEYQLIVKYADVTFEVGNLLIKANKYLLAKESAYFDKLFDYESGPTIKLNGFNPEAFEYIILYLICYQSPTNDGLTINTLTKEKLVKCIAIMNEMMLYLPKLNHIKLYISQTNTFAEFLEIRPYIDNEIMKNLTGPLYQKLSSYISDSKNILLIDFESLLEIFDLSELIKWIPLRIIKYEHIKHFDRNKIKIAFDNFLITLFERWIPYLNNFNLLEHLLKQLKPEDLLSRSLSREELIINNIRYLKINLISSYKLCLNPHFKFKLPIQYKKLYYMGHKEIYLCYRLDIAYDRFNDIEHIDISINRYNTGVGYKIFHLKGKSLLNICYLYKMDELPYDDTYYPLMIDY